MGADRADICVVGGGILGAAHEAGPDRAGQEKGGRFLQRRRQAFGTHTRVRPAQARKRITLN